MGRLPGLAATKGLGNLRRALAAALLAAGGDAAKALILEATADGGQGVEIVDAGADAPKNYAVVSFAERAHVAAALFALQGRVVEVEFGPRTLSVGPLEVRDFPPATAAATPCS